MFVQGNVSWQWWAGTSLAALRCDAHTPNPSPASGRGEPFSGDRHEALFAWQQIPSSFSIPTK
jgi:hypothetical protein